MRILNWYDGTGQHRVDLPTRSLKVMAGSVHPLLKADETSQPSRAHEPGLIHSHHCLRSTRQGPLRDAASLRVLARLRHPLTCLAVTETD